MMSSFFMLQCDDWEIKCQSLASLFVLYCLLSDALVLLGKKKKTNLNVAEM